MKIFLLTSVYPAKNAPKGTTPVVHYFAKEWVLVGHDVHVFHMESAFPWIYYLIGKVFKKIIDSKLGHLVPQKSPIEYDEVRDGVKVTHISLKKTKPHGRFSHNQLVRALEVVSSYFERGGVPDCFVGHWDNPMLELLHMLKYQYHRPTCLVYHSNQFSQLYKCYGNDTEELVNDIDLVGFRNVTAQYAYEKIFGKPVRSFIAASGVSKPFLEAGKAFEKEIRDIKKYVYIGALIHRKYPVSVIDALHKSYQERPFEITYIGEGDDKKLVKKRFGELNCKGKLTFTGRIPREEVIKYLQQSDVFVMISRGEIFGLVYLEAMALGCITIAARNEGIDGIIEDGVNGFLCEAGNSEELATIINKIQGLSTEELNSISQRAKETAYVYSDMIVAQNYIDELKKIIS